MLNRRSILTASIAAALGRLAPSLPAAEPIAQPKVDLDIDLRPLNNAINAAHRMLQEGELDIVDAMKLKDLFDSGAMCTTHEIVRQYKTTVIVRPSEAFLAILQAPGRNLSATLPPGWTISPAAFEERS